MEQDQKGEDSAIFKGDVFTLFKCEDVTGQANYWRLGFFHGRRQTTTPGFDEKRKSSPTWQALHKLLSEEGREG
jgi:hypothetical protein